jgi:hypothetical protein
MDKKLTYDKKIEGSIPTSVKIFSIVTLLKNLDIQLVFCHLEENIETKLIPWEILLGNKVAK